MGVINKSTEAINTLLDKVENMPEQGVTGKTPVLETGETTTLDPGQNATSEVVSNGTDESGNPKYKINFGIPRGADGTGEGGGGVSGSVQWSSVLNKPTWVNSATKPSYTAAEVGALPASTTIPSRTSQLTNDSKFVASDGLKTINGQSIVGSGNVEITGSGSGIADAPSDGKTYGRKDGNWAVIEGAGCSVDITDIMTRLIELSNVGGTCTEEDYNVLKNCVDNGITTYANINGAASQMNILYMGSTIFIRFYLFDGEGSTIQQFEVTSDRIVSNVYNLFLAASVAGDGVLGSYTKPSAYSAITESDTISGAIGKLEAGISNGGSSDVYYLPYAVYNLISGATSEEIKAAFGGDEGIQALKDAMNKKKKIYIMLDESSLKGVIPVSYEFSFNVMWGISFKRKISLTQKNVVGTLRITSIRVYLQYDEGYELNSSFYHLTSSSNSDEISGAIGGESGMRNLIRAIIDGNSIFISASATFSQKTMLITNAYNEADNGDMNILLWGFGYSLWGQLAGAIQISYTKSSNTFSAEVVSL